MYGSSWKLLETLWPEKAMINNVLCECKNTILSPDYSIHLAILNPVNLTISQDNDWVRE